MIMTDKRVELLLKAASMSLSKPLQLEVLSDERG